MLIFLLAVSVVICFLRKLYLEATMAIFKDDNDQHYLGILYNKTADIYSGNFMKVSARGFKLMLAFQWALKRFFSSASH